MLTTPPRKNARPGANIAEVASRAGVSKAAVSRVLNNGYASQAMQEKVRAAMAALDYSPSAAAMNFAAGRTGVIAVVTNNLEGEWIPPLLLGIETTLTQDRRASLLLGSLTHDGKYDSRGVRAWLEEKRVDGAIFIRPRKSEKGLVEMARKKGVIISLIAPDIPAKGGLSLRSDNIQGGQLLAAHLLALGHKRFAYVGGEVTNRDSQERLEGIQRTLKVAGNGVAERDIMAGSFHPNDGRDFAKRWLRRKAATRPTAVLLADDSMAIGFVGSLLEAGVNIPGEVSVTGFNDIPASAWIWPGLTTIRQPLREMGAKACSAILQEIATEAAPKMRDCDDSLMFPVELVVRQTTGVAPR